MNNLDSSFRAIRCAIRCGLPVSMLATARLHLSDGKPSHARIHFREVKRRNSKGYPLFIARRGNKMIMASGPSFFLDDTDSTN